MGSCGSFIVLSIDACLHAVGIGSLAAAYVKSKFVKKRGTFYDLLHHAQNRTALPSDGSRGMTQKRCVRSMSWRLPGRMLGTVEGK
jgi:hypothetical protein